jgi:hypothetical protein
MHVSLLWSEDGILPHDLSVCHLSRVTEKGSLFSILVLTDTLEMLKSRGLLTHAQEICLWSDCGPSYRSVRMLAAAAGKWCRDHRLTIRFRYGAPHHMKSRCDGMFAVYKSKINRASFYDWVVTAGDCQTILRDAYPVGSTTKSRRSGSDDCLIEHCFADFVPTVERATAEKETPALRAATLPLPIQQSFDWSFTPNDVRRVRWTGVDGVSLTACTCRAHVMPGRRSADYATTTRLQLANKEEMAIVVAEECIALDAIEVAATACAGIADAAHFYMGWRCTYRTTTPEVSNFGKTCCKLAKLSNLLVELPEGRRGYQPAAGLPALTT